MTSSRVLILGLDPHSVPGLDAEQIAQALAAAEQRFNGTELDAETVLLPLSEGIEEAAARAISRTPWDCIVIGGGIRKPKELLELFETIVNHAHILAPTAVIAFNTSGMDSLEAARRALSARPGSSTVSA